MDHYHSLPWPDTNSDANMGDRVIHFMQSDSLFITYPSYNSLRTIRSQRMGGLSGLSFEVESDTWDKTAEVSDLGIALSVARTRLQLPVIR